MLNSLPVQDLVDSISQVVGSDHIVTNPEELHYFSNDLFIWEGAETALAVVSPGDVKEVQEVVRRASALGMNLVARGGGMSTARSYVPNDNQSIIVDMRRLNRIREINAADRYMVVEAGCTWEQVHAALPEGWTCETHAPLSGNYSTVGGATAHGFPGGLTGVLGVEVVLANGEVVRTGSWGRQGGKAYYREYGPDLTGLFIGDTGAMGFKTAVSLHLVPKSRARATASYGFDSFEDVAQTFLELAPLDALTTRFCFDPYDTANITKVGLGEGAGVIAKVLSSGPLKQGLVDALKLAKAGLGEALPEKWSINLAAEQFTQASADAVIAEAGAVCRRRGSPIADILGIAGAARASFSVRRFLGRDGERWIATHALFPISEAVEVVRETQAYFKRHRSSLDAHRVRVGYISQVTPVHFQIEPLLYWPDRLDAIHFRHLPDEEARRFKSFEEQPGTRTFIRELRDGLRDLFEGMGSIHVHASKFFRYADVLEPGTHELLKTIKRALDPEGHINPGNLGLK